MRRNNNRKDNAKKERIVMLASSAFVLAALTMTGIYMKSRDAESEDNGYTIDFTALEESVDDKYQEIAQNKETNLTNELEAPDDDLDYTPMEVGSGLVEIPGLTDGLIGEAEMSQAELPLNETEVMEKPDTEPVEEPKETPAETPEDEEASSQDVVVDRTLHFSESDGLIKPVSGDTVIPYSMDRSTYFSTLAQYKYNSAVMIGAEEGSVVSACAEGRVVSIFENEEIGHAITMDLGDGYMITYGQLKGINVTLNSYVEPGEAIASVAAPTKYYSREGSNLYLRLTKDGAPVNPESLF